MRRRFIQLYTWAAVATFTALTIIVCLNVIASFAIQWRTTEASIFISPSELRTSSPTELQQIYTGRTDAEIDAVLRPPPYASHPRLEFRTRPTESAGYNVGIENMRYTGFVDARTATTALQNGVWVFGGSTVFGSGVRDDETIAHFLQARDGTRQYVNLGSMAYTQGIELELLTLLLEKGYRPQRVIFLDGLNDMISALGSPFSAVDTPARIESAYSFDFGVKRIQQLPLKLFWRATPLARWWEGRGQSGGDIYGPADMYVTDPWRHYAGRPRLFDSSPAVLDATARRLVERYRANLDLCAALAAHFDFEMQFFFQPNGLLRTNHPFLRDPTTYHSSEVFTSSVHLTKAIRRAIADGRLAPMVDISSQDHDCIDCYVDVVHYSASFNARLAQRIDEDFATR